MSDFKNFKLICSLNEILECPNFITRNNNEIWNIKFNYSFLHDVTQANFKTIYILTELPFEIDSDTLYVQMHYICRAISDITKCKHVIFDNINAYENQKRIDFEKIPELTSYLSRCCIADTIVVGSTVEDFIFAQSIHSKFSDIRDFGSLINE